MGANPLPQEGQLLYVFKGVLASSINMLSREKRLQLNPEGLQNLNAK